MHHIKSKGINCSCPYTGCQGKVNEKDLEEDAGLARLVKRLKRRLEAEEQQRKQSQAMDMDDDDEACL